MSATPGKRVAACLCALLCVSAASCSMSELEPIPLTAELAVARLDSGEGVRIHTIDGDIIDDAFVRVEAGMLVCKDSTIEMSDVTLIEHRRVNPAVVALGILGGLVGFALLSFAAEGFL